MARVGSQCQPSMSAKFEVISHSVPKLRLKSSGIPLNLFRFAQNCGSVRNT